MGEPVFLDVALHNTANAKIRAAKYFRVPSDDPTKNNFEIYVHDQAGERLSRISHVMTGRAFYYPELVTIAPSETYRDSIQLAGTFVRKEGRKKVKQALWSLGENPELYVSEYPPMTPGDFQVQVIYRINEKHLISLNEVERTEVWQGELVSNAIELSIT